jgi:hypothetical protein
MADRVIRVKSGKPLYRSRRMSAWCLSNRLSGRSMLKRSVLRQIRDTLGRYLAIFFAIIALGVGLFLKPVCARLH